jgi:gliding motility-associated-like protein
MKRALLLSFACICLLSTKSFAQWVEVTNPQNTTQNYGGVDVTVTAVNPSFNGGCEGTYWVANTNDSYTFTFNPAVSAVQFYCDAINTGEETAILVNGQLFPMNNCNVTEYINSCSPGLCNIVNGVFVNNTTMGLCGGLLTVYGNITTVTLLQQLGSSGTTFDVYIPPNTNIPAPSGTVTAGSNSPVNCGDTLHLTATASGATSYSWVGPNGFTSTLQNPSLQVTDLGAGQYIVTAQTSCGAILDTVDVIVAPFTLIPVINTNSPVCQGGQLNLNVGNAPNGSTFNWSGPNLFSSTLGNPVINPVSIADSGLFSVTVTLNNCTSLPGYAVVDVDALPAPPGVTPVTYCLGAPATPLTATGPNLVWYLVPAGGTPLPGAPTPATNIAGTTTYYVASTGPAPTFCEGPRSPVTVTIYAFPVLPNIAYKNSYCANEPFVPFTELSGQNIQYYDSAIGGNVVINPSVDPTQPGTYQFFASQTVNGCESGRFPITIIVHPYVEANFTYSINWGCNSDTVSFQNTSIAAINGYEWDFGDGTTSTEMNPVHVYADQGIYTALLLSKAPYCQDTFSQTFDLNHPLSASFVSDFDTICQNSSINFTNTSVTTTINSIPPSYTWSFGDGSALDPNMNTSHTYTNTGSYIVQMIVTDFVPCKDTAWKYVYVDSASMLSLVTSDSMFCAGQAATFTANYSDIGLMGVSWDYGDGYGDVNVNPARHTYEQQGIYTITFNTDYRICRDTSGTLQVSVRPHPIMNLGPDTSMCPTSGPLVLNDLINGGNANATWLWNTGDRNFNLVIKQPGTYSAAVTIDGCTTSDSVTIVKDCYLDVPNSFTPDGDGLNDFFLPRQLLSKGVTKFKMSIYNRWGQEVYATTQINGRGWDGKLNDVPQPQGVFVYLIEVTFHNGMSEKKQGNVTLLR